MFVLKEHSDSGIFPTLPSPPRRGGRDLRVTWVADTAGTRTTAWAAGRTLTLRQAQSLIDLCSVSHWSLLFGPAFDWFWLPRAARLWYIVSPHWLLKARGGRYKSCRSAARLLQGGNRSPPQDGTAATILSSVNRLKLPTLSTVDHICWWMGRGSAVILGRKSVQIALPSPHSLQAPWGKQRPHAIGDDVTP